jgi:hypothetical protein
LACAVGPENCPFLFSKSTIHCTCTATRTVLFHFPSS